MEAVEGKILKKGGSLVALLFKVGLPGLVILLLLLFLLLTGLIFSFFSSESESRGITGGEPTELALNMIPSEFFPIYQAAGKMYGVPWNLLAAQHKVETDFSGIADMTSYVGAIGHMQFMPLTWIGWSYPGGDLLGNASIPKEILTDPAMIQKYGGFGTDGNGDGVADPYNLEDAIFSAANYLAANGAADGNIEKAVFAYNHADWYVTKVLDYANTFASIGNDAVSVDGLTWPVPFTQNITSNFGMRIDPFTRSSDYHNGTDIAAGGINGKPVVSMSDGKVIHSGYLGSYGNAVIVSHANGYESLYGHLSSLAVKTGQDVKAGQEVGKVGSTGRSSGPHLHFVVKINGKEIDPMSLFNK